MNRCWKRNSENYLLGLFYSRHAKDTIAYSFAFDSVAIVKCVSKQIKRQNNKKRRKEKKKQNRKSKNGKCEVVLKTSPSVRQIEKKVLSEIEGENWKFVLCDLNFISFFLWDFFSLIFLSLFHFSFILFAVFNDGEWYFAIFRTFFLLLSSHPSKRIEQFENILRQTHNIDVLFQWQFNGRTNTLFVFSHLFFFFLYFVFFFFFYTLYILFSVIFFICFFFAFSNRKSQNRCSRHLSNCFEDGLC